MATLGTNTRYIDLGIRPVINAAATLTRLGGSLMPPPVLDAMRAGAESFVDLPELQRKVGEDEVPRGRYGEILGNAFDNA